MSRTINLLRKGLISTIALAVLVWPALTQDNKLKISELPKNPLSDNQPAGNAPEVTIKAIRTPPPSKDKQLANVAWEVKTPAGVEIKGFSVELVATYADGSTEKRQAALNANARVALFDVPAEHVVSKQFSNSSSGNKSTRSASNNNNKERRVFGAELSEKPTVQATDSPATSSGGSNFFEIKSLAVQIQTRFRTSDLARVTGKFTPAPDFATSLKLTGGGQSGAPANLRVNQLVLRKVARPEAGCQPNGCLELSFGAQPTPGTTLSESKITLILRLKDNSRLEASKSVNATTTSTRFSLDAFRSTGAPPSVRLPIVAEDVLRQLASAEVQIENKVTIETAVVVNKSK